MFHVVRRSILRQHIIEVERELEKENAVKQILAVYVYVLCFWGAKIKGCCLVRGVPPLYNGTIGTRTADDVMEDTTHMINSLIVRIEESRPDIYNAPW